MVDFGKETAQNNGPTAVSRNGDTPETRSRLATPPPGSGLGVVKRQGAAHFQGVGFLLQGLCGEYTQHILRQGEGGEPFSRVLKTRQRIIERETRPSTNHSTDYGQKNANQIPMINSRRVGIKVS